MFYDNFLVRYCNKHVLYQCIKPFCWTKVHKLKSCLLWPYTAPSSSGMVNAEQHDDFHWYSIKMETRLYVVCLYQNWNGSFGYLFSFLLTFNHYSASGNKNPPMLFLGNQCLLCLFLFFFLPFSHIFLLSGLWRAAVEPGDGWGWAKPGRQTAPESEPQTRG